MNTYKLLTPENIKPAWWILPIIVISQFFCTSLWFAGNAVMTDLVSKFDLSIGALGHLTSAIQFGFISGTLVFALLTVADRFSPSKVFMISAILAAVFNLFVTYSGNNLFSLCVLRLSTGFFLAGIYPIGMKIAADYYEKGLGKSLGFLVGALVVGTAFPHLLKGISYSIPWKYILFGTSGLAVAGGFLMLFFIPDGPYRKSSQKVELTAFFKVFQNSEFRSAAFGYFGHMWELYAFWAFVPLMLKTFQNLHPGMTLNISLWSFFIIGIGGLACVLSGYLSQSVGVKRTATLALMLSCICCLVSPLFFAVDSQSLFLGFLLFWGVVVIADSPLFSTLVAKNAPIELKGTALTIVNNIGYTVTIVSIQIMNVVSDSTNSYHVYALLAIGPMFGILALIRKNQSKAEFQ